MDESACVGCRQAMTPLQRYKCPSKILFIIQSPPIFSWNGAQFKWGTGALTANECVSCFHAAPRFDRSNNCSRAGVVLSAWWTQISLCASAKAAELQHGDIKHPQEEHQRHLWQPEDAQEERQRERAHHAGQEGVASAVTGKLDHGVIGAAVHVDDDDGAVGVGTTPQPGHAAHLEITEEVRWKKSSMVTAKSSPG